MKKYILGVALGVLMAAASPVFAAQGDPLEAQEQTRINRQVRKQLVMLPFYTIFDHFEFALDGNTLTLVGEVSRPSLKRSAERVAIRVEGVHQVVNNIEVLPFSSFDNRIRLAVFRAIYGDSVLNRYALRSVGPIHILVRNGDVTLKGVVSREMEKNIAGIRANGVFGVFSVSNELRVEQG